VLVERDDGRLGASLGGEAAHLGDHRLVPEVDAVVGPDGDDRVAVPGRVGDVGDDLHG
jgi:hypothetical protein